MFLSMASASSLSPAFNKPLPDIITATKRAIHSRRFISLTLYVPERTEFGDCLVECNASFNFCRLIFGLHSNTMVAWQCNEPNPRR